MSSVFVVIVEEEPAGGDYPASHNDSFHSNETSAWLRLDELAWSLGLVLRNQETSFLVENDERYNYREFRIEEHEVKHNG